MTALFVFVRALGELGLWLGIGGMVLSIFTGLSDLLAVLPLLSGVLLLCQLAGNLKRPLRFVPLALMLPAFALCHRVGDWLLILPAACYCAMSVFTFRLTPDRNVLYYRFGVLGLVGLGSAFLCLMGGLNWCFACCAIGLAANLFLSRMLRHEGLGTQTRPLLLLELGFLAALCLVCFLLSRQVVLMWFWEAFQKLFLWVGLPIIMLILYALQIIVWVIAKLFPLKSDAVPMRPDSGMLIDSLPPEIVEQVNAAGNPISVFLVRLLVIAGFLAAAWFALQFLRRGGGRLALRTPPESEALLSLDRERAAFAPPAFLDRSPEASIRRSYLSYCRHVQDMSRRLRQDDTTRTVNTLAGRDSDPAARELRSLYLRARYQNQGTVTREDARRAAHLVRELSKTKP